MENLLYKNIATKFEIKQIDDNFVHLEGLASTFGNLDRDGDIIIEGAFKKTLANPDIKLKLLNQHKFDEPLGTIDKAIETSEGLFIMARMPKANSKVRDIIPLLEMGALSDFSIGFQVVDADISPDGNRLIKEINLFEVSIVTMPANPKAKITSVKDVEGIKTKREFEQILMDTKHFTRKACTALASRFNTNEEKRDSIIHSKEQKQRDSVSAEKLLQELNKFKQLIN